MDTKNVGLIGLGIMGMPMAHNLIKAGYSLTAYSRSPETVQQIKSQGANAATSSAEVAEHSSIVITMVPDSADSKNAILGSEGALAGASPGTMIIDMSSIAPGVSQEIANACESENVDFLDAPVSGGEAGAIAGTLAIMVGGHKDIFNQCNEVLSAMGSSVTYCGEHGAGNITKLANQIIVAANIEAVGEALVLAKKAGLDPNIVFEAIKGGLAGSTVLNAKAPMMISGDFKPGFRIRLHQKDLHNALLTGKELGVPLPVTSLVQQMIGSLVNHGKGDSDHSVIATHIEDMANITICDN